MSESFDWNAVIVLLNTITLAVIAYFARRQAKAKEEEVLVIKNGHIDVNTADTEGLWNEVNDIRSILNKTLQAVNKQLRSHGRTLQAEEKSDFSGSKPGMIRPPLA